MQEGIPTRPSKQRLTVLLALWLLLITVDVFATFGVSKLKFGHGLERVFSSSSQRYLDFAEAQDVYGRTYGLQLLVEGDDLAEASEFAGLLDVVLALQLTDGVEAVYSPFSTPIRTIAGVTATLDTLSGDPKEAWSAAHTAQPLLKNRITLDRQTAVVTIIADDSAATLDRIELQVAEILSQAGLSYMLTGLPMVLERSSEGLQADFVILNSVGAALGATVAVIAISGWWVAMTTLLASGTAVLWGIGALGWMGVEMNVLSVALPILILALSFSDSAHVGIEQRKALLEGAKYPIRETLYRMAPAVLLTSITTAIAFLSLGFAGSDLISEMGIGGAIAVLAASIGVLAAAGLLGASALAVVGPQRFSAGRAGSTRPFFNWAWLPRFGLRHTRSVTVAGLVMTVLSCISYLSADTRFSFYESLQKSDRHLIAIERINTRLSPTAAVLISVVLNDAEPLQSAQAVDETMRKFDGALTPVSLATLANSTGSADGDLEALLEQLPPQLRTMLAGTQTGELIVMVPFIYQGSAQTRAFVTGIEAALANADFKLSFRTDHVTGPEVMSAFVSEEMISALSLSLFLSVLGSGLVIAIWLRSVRAGLVALAPNLLPVVMVGGLLGISGFGISFAAGIALTLAFGIAVDDTIHVLNRYRLAPGQGLQRVETAMKAAVPPMVVTTLVLIAGLSGSVAASLPSVVEFGLLAMTVFGIALITDLIFLPALMRKFLP